MNNAITVETIVNAPIEKVWAYWNEPEHISNWAFASDDWKAEAKLNDLRAGGRFETTMSAKDGSEGFSFGGVYSDVQEHELIEYDMDDGRHVAVEFSVMPEGVKIVQTFDPETENPEDVQRAGWQSILDTFKKYAEQA